jgi:hypothetical protein
MSQYSVVGDVSETLRDVLWAHMETDSSVTAILADRNHISFEPPFRLFTEQGPQENNLSIYLYRVVENPDLKNRPQFPDPAPDYRFPPLTLNFFYLVTPLTNSALNDYKLLGKTMQAFYDNAIIRGSDLHGLLGDNSEEIRLSLNSASLEDMTKLWCAFLRPYRLSVSYEVRAVIVDSERTTRVERVRRKRLEFEQIEVT